MAIGVHVGSDVIPTSTGNQDITLPAGVVTAMNAGPYAIILQQVGYGTMVSGTWAAHAVMGVGLIAKDSGGSITQYAAGNFMQDATAAGSRPTDRRMQTGCVTMPGNITGGTTETRAASFVGTQGSTAMRLNWTDIDASWGGSRLNFIIITGLTNAKVVSQTYASGNVTGVGFSPDLIFNLNVAHTSLASVVSAYFTFGVVNQHGQQWSNSFSSGEVSNTDSARWFQTDAFVATVNYNNTEIFGYPWTGMTSDGFTHYTLGAGYVGAFLCLDGISSKIGTFLSLTGPTTFPQRVPTGQGFVPRGALFSGSGENSTTGIPTTHASWWMGMSDGTNHLAGGIFDRDNRATSQSHSLWFSNKALMAPNTDASTSLNTHEGAPVLTTSNEMLVNWSYIYPADVQRWNHYVLLGDAGTDTFPQAVLA